MREAGFAIILPARFESTRFPGKPLATVAGKPLIEWVYRRAEKVRGASTVLVATDSEEIARAVRSFGGKAVMTSRGHRNGTERVAEAARGVPCDVIVNLQGDEPVVPEGLVEEMVNRLRAVEDASIVTACHAIERRGEMSDPNIVKVVTDREGRAIYFSRSPIPYGAWKSVHDGGYVVERAWRHIGIYVFRREALMSFADLEPSPLEKAEGLEQLRALENGMKILVVVSDEATIGVDAPGDIKTVEKFIARNYTGSEEG